MSTFLISDNNFQIHLPNGLVFSTVIHELGIGDYSADEVEIAIIENGKLVTSRCPYCPTSKRHHVESPVKLEKWLKILSWCLKQSSQEDKSTKKAGVKLDKRERYILENRILKKRGGKLSLREISEKFGISTERVRQIEARLKIKLKDQLKRFI